MRVGEIIRFINALLSGGVVGLCFLKVDLFHPDRARNIRIAGLGVLCLAITWGSFGRLDEDFKPWLPLVTVGLILSFYGMRRVAAGEPSFRHPHRRLR